MTTIVRHPEFSPTPHVDLHDDITESGHLDVLAAHPRVRLSSAGSWLDAEPTSDQEVSR